MHSRQNPRSSNQDDSNQEDRTETEHMDDKGNTRKIKLRDELKTTRHNNEEAYKEMDEKVKKLINDKKQDIWKKGHQIARQQKHVATNKKSERRNNQEEQQKLNQELRKWQPSNENTAEFNMQELITALHRINGNKAEGPEDTPENDTPSRTRSFEVHSANVQRILEEHENTAELETCRHKTNTQEKQEPRGCQQLQSNKPYSPISLTSVIGKWLERMINNRLRHFLETKQLLNQAQGGFRARRSTYYQLITYYHLLPAYYLLPARRSTYY